MGEPTADYSLLLQSRDLDFRYHHMQKALRMKLGTNTYSFFSSEYEIKNNTKTPITIALSAILNAGQ